MRAAAMVLAAALLVGCGSAVCGNGDVEGGEQCDDGNLVDGDGCSATCRYQATIDTYVHFDRFIYGQFPGFDRETCGGLEIAQVEVTLTGPKTVSQRVACSLGQVKLSSLPAGQYTASAKAFAGDGTLLSKGMAGVAFSQGDQELDVQIVWPYEDFVRSYKGTYYFAVLWGGSGTCADASPAVAKQRLLLSRNGVALAGTTDGGDPLDGSKAGSCRNGNESLAQAAVALPWGPAKMTIVGEDPSGTELYRGTFDTFVGAGASNSVAEFDVPSLFPPDAGVADGGGT